jgi:hypothetical protein
MPQKIPDAEMLPKCVALAKTYTEEMHSYLISLFTTPERYREATERFQASYNASLDKAPENVAACEADRQNLNRQHSVLMGMAKVASLLDPSVPEKLGVGTLTASPVAGSQSLSKPDKFKMVYGANSGEMTGSVTSIKGARMIEIWGCVGDPNDEGNWKLMAASPNCTGIKVTGLAPGTKYWFRARAVRSGESGPWSNYLTLMAI